MNPSPWRHLPKALLQTSALLIAVFSAALLAHAQDEPAADQPAPARLGVVEGPVSFWRPGMDDWAPAQLNAALAAGDSVSTGSRGTVEIQIGQADFVRLSGGTLLSLVAQESGLQQFRVGNGTASFDLRSAQAAQLVEIDTANAAVVVGSTGYYRIDVRGDATYLIVRHGGRATLTLPDGRSQSIGPGEELVATGTDRPMVERHAAAAPDSWDRWNDARSDYTAAALSNRYVPAGVYGAADLDRNGTWRDVDDYGSVWVPAVASGWSPYSTGTWQWDPAFGWTWVDEAPWGWSTSHYGRWVFIDGYWAWAPGPRVHRVAYAPALVAFFGVGSGISWVPLGWGEPVVPWWGRPGFRGQPWWGGWGGPHIVNNVVVRGRVGDVGSIVYRNSGVSHAVIGMREEEFGRTHIHGSRLPPLRRDELVTIRGEHPIRPAQIGIERQRPVTNLPQPPSVILPTPARNRVPMPERREPPAPSTAPVTITVPSATPATPAAPFGRREGRERPERQQSPMQQPIQQPMQQSAPAVVPFSHREGRVERPSLQMQQVPQPAPAMNRPAPAVRVEPVAPVRPMPQLEPRVSGNTGTLMQPGNTPIVPMQSRESRGPGERQQQRDAPPQERRGEGRFDRER